MIYKSEDVLRIAKRHNNSKRSYLLVNPLQGKHIPVRPSSALEMMKTLGSKIAIKYPDTKLVIGFAETATAIGAMVAASLDDCIYVHTTRENVQPCIEFLEEHSHAPEQRLYCEKLNDWLSNTSTVIFVDDELSTGKTLRNMIRQLKATYPVLNDKILVAASIINRLTSENEALFKIDGIESEYLLKLYEQDFDISAEAKAPKLINTINVSKDRVEFKKISIPLNPRLGVSILKYINSVQSLGNEVANSIKSAKTILVLGTEECMLPAIFVGEILENAGFNVLTHSTTRSPIGISNFSNYPINEGYQLRSFYDVNRTTYIYNLQYYDLILVISDVKQWHRDSVESLIAALNVHGYGKVIFVGDGDVQYI